VVSVDVSTIETSRIFKDGLQSQVNCKVPTMGEDVHSCLITRDEEATMRTSALINTRKIDFKRKTLANTAPLVSRTSMRFDNAIS
jgi:hypothetical protein